MQATICQHELEYKIERLKSRFLHQAVSPEEWEAIDLITKRFLQYLPEQHEAKQWLEQTKKSSLIKSISAQIRL